MVTASERVAGRSRDKKLKVKKETIRDLSVKGRANEVKGGNLSLPTQQTYTCRVLPK